MQVKARRSFSQSIDGASLIALRLSIPLSFLASCVVTIFGGHGLAPLALIYVEPFFGPYGSSKPAAVVFAPLFDCIAAALVIATWTPKHYLTNGLAFALILTYLLAQSRMWSFGLDLCDAEYRGWYLSTSTPLAIGMGVCLALLIRLAIKCVRSTPPAASS